MMILYQYLKKTLSGPTQCFLKVQGQFLATLQRGNRVTKQNVYVVQELNRALLGLPAIEALQVVSYVEPIQASQVCTMFLNLFTGLGKLQGSYHIKLRNDVKTLHASSTTMSSFTTNTKSGS